MNNLEKYDSVIRRVFDFDNDVDLKKEVVRNNCAAWDSFLHITFVAELEDEFMIMLDTDDILSLDSYESGIEVLKKNGIEF